MRETRFRQSCFRPWTLRRLLWLALLIVGLPILAATAAAPPAAAATEESWGYDLSHDLMSPFCPGRSLATCPSPQAAELVQWIVMQEAAGASQEQVVEMLIERYGEEILGAPPARGITLWAYIFPVLGIVGGGGLAFLVLRRIVGSKERADADATAETIPITAPRPLRGEAAPPADEELARIIDAELAGRRA